MLSRIPIIYVLSKSKETIVYPYKRQLSISKLGIRGLSYTGVLA